MKEFKQSTTLEEIKAAFRAMFSELMESGQIECTPEGVSVETDFVVSKILGLIPGRDPQIPYEDLSEDDKQLALKAVTAITAASYVEQVLKDKLRKT